MKSPNHPAVMYQQRGFYPPHAVEITLKIGVLESNDHAQFELEMLELPSRRTMALGSRPHVALFDALSEFDAWVIEARELLAEQLPPF